MPIALDVITRKKLILVRQIYQRAVLQSEVLHSDFDRIMSLIAFDLANETVLKAVVGALEPSKSTDKGFQGIVQQADALLVKKGLTEVPDKAKIQHVHGLRNDAQHKAKYPNPNDVSDSRTYTRDFLQQLITNVWGQDFYSISLTEVIRHPRVKSLLEQAEQELRQDSIVKAVGYAKAAFELSVNKVKSSVVGRFADTIKTSFTVQGKQFHLDSSMVDTFKKISNAVFLSVVGLDYPSYLNYKKLSMYIHVRIFGDRIEMNDGGKHITVQDTEYVINYVVNSVIQIESIVGDIEKPFEL